MKRLILAGLVCAAAFGATLSTPKVQADPPNCAAVLCLPCPEGTVAAPTPGNCCRCVRQ